MKNNIWQNVISIWWKTLSKPEIEGNLLYLIKGSGEKPIAKIKLHGKRPSAFPLSLGKTGISDLTNSIQHCTVIQVKG